MIGWLLATFLVGNPAPAGAPPKPVAHSPAVTATHAPPGQALPGPPVKMEGRDVVDASVPAKYRDEVKQAQWQGALLQQEDFAVWAASNALVQSGMKAPGTVTGWLAQPVDALARNWKVSFTAKDAQRQYAYADVDIDLSAPPPKVKFAGHAKGRDLSADELALARARDAIAARDDWLRCAGEYNYSSSFVTGKKGREILVRALPAREDGKLYLLGGFHEFRIPLQGGKSQHEQQTNTCLDLPLPKNGIAFMVTHLRSSTPTQFHVFANLSYQRPVYVRIGSRTWKVQRGRITVEDKNSVKSLKTEKPAAK